MSQSTPELKPRKERLEPGSLREQRQTLADTCGELLRAGDEGTLRLVLNSHHAADLADLVRRLGKEIRPRIFGLLGAGLAAQTLAAADLLAELPPDLCGRMLEQMESGQAAEIEELLAHAEESGGGIMTSRLIAVRDSITVSESVHYLREWAGDEEILSLFVVDDDGRLTGTLSLRRLLLAEPETVIEDLVEPDPISVQVDVDKEEIARIFAEYDLLAVPVVEEGGELVGQVTVDDIVDVIRDEATEDIYEMAAMSSEEIGERSTFAVMRRRLPWLLLCLAGTLACGAVIDRFEDLLSRLGALILFVPAIMAMGGTRGFRHPPSPCAAWRQRTSRSGTSCMWCGGSCALPSAWGWSSGCWWEGWPGCGRRPGSSPPAWALPWPRRSSCQRCWVRWCRCFSGPSESIPRFRPGR